VVLVGWGSSNGQDYYILRNSWGPSWGDKDSTENNGYMLISRGSAYGKAGMCGLLSEPYYPVV
jgi:C1A family cysteine protease